MQRQVIQHQNEGNLREIFLESCYSGERFVLVGSDGVAVGIVPVEDLEMLEEMDGKIFLEKEG